jgi:hypothetical protein
MMRPTTTPSASTSKSSSFHRRTGALDQRVNDALDVEFEMVDRGAITLARATWLDG